MRLISIFCLTLAIAIPCLARQRTLSNFGDWQHYNRQYKVISQRNIEDDIAVDFATSGLTANGLLVSNSIYVVKWGTAKKLSAYASTQKAFIDGGNVNLAKGAKYIWIKSCNPTEVLQCIKKYMKFDRRYEEFYGFFKIKYPVNANKFQYHQPDPDDIRASDDPRYHCKLSPKLEKLKSGYLIDVETFKNIWYDLEDKLVVEN